MISCSTSSNNCLLIYIWLKLICFKVITQWIKVTDEFFWNFRWMFSTKHCFEKYNKNDRSPFSFKGWDGPITSFVPILVLITRVIHRSTLHFEVARNIVYKSNTRGKNLTGRNCRAYRTILYKLCGNITLFETTLT